MKKLSFVLLLASFMALAAIPPVSAEISANVDLQRYGVRNLSKNESTYSQNIIALEGHELEFSLNLKNTSGHQASGAVLYVYLPIGFPLDSNSIYIDGTRTGGNISNGLFLGNIDANSQKDIVFKTKINVYFNGYAAIQALVIGNNFSTASQYVSVTKNGSANNTIVYGFTPSPTPWPTPTPTNQSHILGISVLGKNLTKQNTNWQKTIKAEPGDLLQFSIMLTANTGLTVRNVYLKDTLDSFLDFVSGSVKINDTPASDALISGQLFSGDLTASSVKFVKFQAQVRNAPQFGKEAIILSNIAQVWAENNSLISDSSSVSVAVKQTEEKKPVAVVATVKKNTSSGLPIVATKSKLIAPKETAKTASKNSFLGGTIAFGSFWLLIILILIALVIFLAISLDREKKKNRELTLTKTNPA
ncbi:MAG: hypothetical protein G01um101444_463 [Parcubacteria group bacterium Gr01-1014_44]|nr:MAG: hypothetical protein G01um101444_463 [Parcubacteria group bacterium Gr01-1014_44]